MAAWVTCPYVCLQDPVPAGYEPDRLLPVVHRHPDGRWGEGEHAAGPAAQPQRHPHHRG